MSGHGLSGTSAPWRAALLGALCLATAASAGCVGISGPASLARQVRQAEGVELQRQFGLDVGGTLANLALRIAATESGIELDAGHLDRVEVGVYELTGAPVDGTSIFDGVGDDGWIPCVRVRGRGEEVRVLLRGDDGSLSGVAVLVRDGRDVVIARVRGELGPLAEQAIALALDETRRELAREGLLRDARGAAQDGRTTLSLTDRAGAEETGLVM